MQHCWPKSVARCWTKILSKFKLKPTSSNIVFKRGQHVAPTMLDDVGPTKLASFEQALRIYSLKFQTERGRRLNLPWDFNYSLVLLNSYYELHCIHSRRRHVAVRKIVRSYLTLSRHVIACTSKASMMVGSSF